MTTTKTKSKLNCACNQCGNEMKDLKGEPSFNFPSKGLYKWIKCTKCINKTITPCD